jgi:uncharacterized protein (DUF2384 family)
MRNAITSSPEQPAPPARQPALQVFFGIAEEWALTTEQQMTLLGSPARSTFFKWKKDGGAISGDTEERISHIVAIYKALNILFPDPEEANGWIKRPNKYFDSCSALDVMMSGRLAEIYAVRAYVDAQRGG